MNRRDSKARSALGAHRIQGRHQPAVACWSRRTRACRLRRRAVRERATRRASRARPPCLGLISVGLRVLAGNSLPGRLRGPGGGRLGSHFWCESCAGVLSALRWIARGPSRASGREGLACVQNRVCACAFGRIGRVKRSGGLCGVLAASGPLALAPPRLPRVGRQYFSGFTAELRGVLNDQQGCGGRPQRVML